MASSEEIQIPKTCKAGVVVNEGPDFRVEVQDVPVPEPGITSSFYYESQNELLYRGWY